MVDFPVCPSSERTMSVLPPFCRGIVKIGRFYRKVVSISLFAETLPKLKNCTAQSLSRFATAPFTQGSLSRVHPRTLERYRAGQTQMKPTAYLPVLPTLCTREPLMRAVSSRIPFTGLPVLQRFGQYIRRHQQGSH